MTTHFFDHIQPLELARQALGTELAKFVALHRDAHFLAIQITDPIGPVAAGLSATAGDERTPIAPGMHLLSYNTVFQAVGPVAASTSGTGADNAQKQLARRARRTLQFFVPLRKRATVQSAFQKRISVGRATNQDIVLRDGSVSKSHAWFEVDENGMFHVADSGSTNGTKLEGKALEPRATVLVEHGQLITFGTVEALMCSAEDIWRVFDGARDEWPKSAR